jgi:hypothetical protein
MRSKGGIAMAFEFIRRKEGETSQKQEIRHKNVQISINDWGHLCIREFDEPHMNDDEHLIVFDKATTERIINFIFNIRSTFELKQLLKDITKKNINDLPF